MTCARTGEAAGVRALLARGANVNAKEPGHDQTALMWAAAQAHPEAVDALLRGGADVRARSRSYIQTVTSEVTQRAGREELNYTVPRGGSTALLFAARSGDVESVQAARSRRAPMSTMPCPTAPARWSSPPTAATVAWLTLLLDKGADPNAAAVGYTALHAAVLRSDLDLVKSLLAHRANPNAQITKGTPVRRNSQDFELPKTLIGATPYLLAAKFLEAGHHAGAGGRRRRYASADEGWRDAVDGGSRDGHRRAGAGREARHRSPRPRDPRRRQGRTRQPGTGRGLDGAEPRERHQRGQSRRRHGAAHRVGAGLWRSRQAAGQNAAPISTREMREG